MAQDDDYIELGPALSEISYPCGKDELLRLAQLNGSDNDLLTRLDLLPDRVYEGMYEALEFADDPHFLSGEPLA